MKFYEAHFTFHHFKHNPHRWFAALLLSPIHHAEMRYKTKYHLKFAHAKKLFVFDMLLMLSTVVLFVATMFWWLYDPTVTALVHLDVTATITQERFQSGDNVTLHITYQNESDVTLTHPELVIHPTPGFLLTQSTAPYIREKDHSIRVSVSAVPPGDSGSVDIEGQFFSPPGDHTPISTMLIYTQEGNSTPESDIHRLYLTTREPSLSFRFDGPPQYIAKTAIPVTLTVTNEQNFEYPSFVVPFNEDETASTWTTATSSFGIVSNNQWEITRLAPHASATLSGTLVLTPSSDQTSLTIPITPLISLPHGDTTFVEATIPFTFSFAYPQVRLSSSWDSTYATLGDKALLTVSVQNTGNAPLENPRVTVLGKTVTLEKNVLQPGETVPVVINTSVITTNVIQSTNGPIFAPRILFEAGLPSIPSYTYQTASDAPPLPIGTTVSLSQSSRYYTDEGDQLGRGSLPPQVGKETKYWVFTQIKNTVGELEDITFSTTIAPGAMWTGKSSVSKGGDITYNASTGKATWSTRSMNPYETIGIYFEVSVTPSASAIGTIPALLTGSSVSANDPYIDDTLSSSVGAINASLSDDSIGQAKGVRVR